MHSFIAASVLLAFAAAAPAPVPQDIDFELAYALPNPPSSVSIGVVAQTVTYNPTSILASALPQITSSVIATANDTDATATLAKRTACALQPSEQQALPPILPTLRLPFWLTQHLERPRIQLPRLLGII